MSLPFVQRAADPAAGALLLFLFSTDSVIDIAKDNGFSIRATSERRP
jgi:hypothetical protein